MKHFFYIVLFSIVYTPGAFSQYCNENIPPGTTILDWDWTVPQFEVWIKPPGTQNSIQQFIDSPFFLSTSVGQPNTGFLAHAPLNGEPLDFDPDDGWELIIKEFGNPTPGGGIRFPVLVLYNRIEGKLRSFFYLADVSGVNEAALRVSNLYNSALFHISAALEHANTPMQPIENYEDLGRINETPNVFEGASGIWIMSDVPILYDPCTCQYGSGLKIQSFSLESEDIDLVLEGTGTIEQIIDDGNTVSNDEKGFNINSIGDAIGGAATKGSKSYKNGSKFVKDLDKTLVEIANGNIDAEVQDILEQLGYGPDVDAGEIRDIWETISQAGVPPASNLANAFNTMLPQTVSSILPGWIKDAIPYASSALSVIDFLISGAKKSPPKPMKFNTNSTFTGSGTISNTNPLQSIEFYTPGSDNLSGVSATIPVYNNVMGVFSVVEKIEVNHQKGYDEDEDGAYYHDAYVLNAPLKYAVNPSAGLNTTPIDIKASLHFYNPGPLSDYPPLPGSYYSSGLIKVEDSHYRTPYVPLSCLSDYTVHLYETRLNEGLCIECHPIPEVRLHVMASFERSDNAPGAETEMVAQMYEVAMKTTISTIGQNPFLTIPENTFTDDLEQIIRGNLVAWNDITYTGNILITEDNKDRLEELFFPPQVVEVEVPGENGEPGYTTTENIFQVVPPVGSTITGPLVIQNPPSCFQEVPPVDKNFLESFCANTQRYNPVAAARSNTEENPPVKDELTINLYPNPTIGRLNLQFFLPEESKIHIQIKNLLGQMVIPSFELSYTKGEHLYLLDCKSFTAGMYLIELAVNGKRYSTMKFLKI